MAKQTWAGLRLSKRHKSNMTWDGMDGGAAGVG